jgi:hypothetical protein
MNQVNNPSENFDQQQEESELTPLQVLGILIAIGLLCAGIYHLFKSSQNAGNIAPPNISSRLSASELIDMLNT